MPKLYVIPQEQPNAFATGRNPSHSAVAVTAGIRKLLSEDELRGVLAHELGHVRNHDILLTSVASAIGSAITWIAYTLLWFGGDNDSPLGAIGAIALVLLAPLAAGIIQMAISRQREFSADATGAEICGNPESLASALLRLEAGSQAIPMQVNQAAGAALHRQAVQRRRLRLALLDASADRGAGPPAPPDAADHRLIGISGSEFEGRLLASLEPDGGREHRPRQAARGADPRRPALAPPSRPGLDQAPALRASTSSTSCSRGGTHADRRRADHPRAALGGAGRAGAPAAALQRHRRPTPSGWSWALRGRASATPWR